jgi:DNA-binding transcriptional ArsR family regulator
MVQYSRNRLDDTFAALSDSTRRGVLLQLGRGNASITELAGQFRMTLTGMNKHVGILEKTGLVKTQKTGRVRTCMLGSCRLEAEIAWIEGYKETWDRRFDALELVVQELKQRKENK